MGRNRDDGIAASYCREEHEHLLERRRSLLSPEPGLKDLLDNTRFGSAARELLESRASWGLRADAELAFEQRSDALIGHPGLADFYERTRLGISEASEFVRSHALLSDQLWESECLGIAGLRFAGFPEWLTPHWDELRWAGVPSQSHRHQVVRLAELGWTNPVWIRADAVTMFRLYRDDEIDQFFVTAYLGSDGTEKELENVQQRLLSSGGLSQWRSLLVEVFECLENGRYAVTVPPLLTVLEGFTMEALVHEQKASKRSTKVAASIKNAQWHGEESFTSLMWMSIVIFLDRLFANAPFDSPIPGFINRHWILHGRSGTEWTAADALKLLNALDTLTWLST